MNKSFLGLVLIVVLAVASLFLFSPEAKYKFEANAVHPLDNVKGNRDASVVLIEYSDFECPACRSYYPVLREIYTEFGDRIAFVYRHFPLTSIHANAEFAARAAEAAGKQDKFWEMHDLLFQKQAEWSKVADIVPVFRNYAALVGLDVEKFETDFRSKEVKDFVNSQKSHAVSLGFPGTPTFVLNGEVIDNPSSVDQFRSIIQAKIRETQN